MRRAKTSSGYLLWYVFLVILSTVIFIYKIKKKVIKKETIWKMISVYKSFLNVFSLINETALGFFVSSKYEWRGKKIQKFFPCVQHLVSCQVNIPVTRGYRTWKVETELLQNNDVADHVIGTTQASLILTSVSALAGLRLTDEHGRCLGHPQKMCLCEPVRGCALCEAWTL